MKSDKSHKRVSAKEKTRRTLKKHLGVSLYYLLRDLMNRKDKYLFNKKTFCAIKAKLAARNGQAIADDLEFIEFLHSQFPHFESEKDDLQNLLTDARTTFDEISALGVPLENARILDIGCGYGETLLASNEYGVGFALGIDYNPECRNVFEKLKSNFEPSKVEHTNYLSCDFLSSELESDSFDVVISIASFEHYDDPVAVLKACHCALRKGGYLFAQFDPLFLSPFGAHRFGTSGTPYIQNLFSDQTVFEFLAGKRADALIHPSKKTQLSIKDPYAEMNRWTVRQFDELFSQPDQWEVVSYRRRQIYKYYFMYLLFRTELAKFAEEDLFTAGITILLRKK